MPLLEYRCQDCAHVFERLVPRTSGAEQAECPACGQPRGQRLLSVFAQVRGGDGAVTTVNSGTCCGGACGCH